MHVCVCVCVCLSVMGQVHGKYNQVKVPSILSKYISKQNKHVKYFVQKVQSSFNILVITEYDW